MVYSIQASIPNPAVSHTPFADRQRRGGSSEANCVQPYQSRGHYGAPCVLSGPWTALVQTSFYGANCNEID